MEACTVYCFPGILNITSFAFTNGSNIRTSWVGVPYSTTACLINWVRNLSSILIQWILLTERESELKVLTICSTVNPTSASICIVSLFEKESRKETLLQPEEDTYSKKYEAKRLPQNFKRIFELF